MITTYRLNKMTEESYNSSHFCWLYFLYNKCLIWKAYLARNATIGLKEHITQVSIKATIHINTQIINHKYLRIAIINFWHTQVHNHLLDPAAAAVAAIFSAILVAVSAASVAAFCLSSASGRRESIDLRLL